MDYTERSTCRCCKNTLVSVVDFGELALTSQFPPVGEKAIRAPLHLMKCPVCHLLQLKHTVSPELMYTADYGYASGVNETMVNHLADFVADIAQKFVVRPGDAVLDIACNDGTLLKAWEPYGVTRYGVDPIAADVPSCSVVKDYFKRDVYTGMKVITSVAVLYDLEDPVEFVTNIAAALNDDGVWAVEVQYAGEIFEGKWDQICHEHLCYYGLSQVMHVANCAGLYFHSASLNDSNGGSLRAYFTKTRTDNLKRGFGIVNEEYMWNTVKLADDITASAAAVAAEVRRHGRVVILGASTKGNTLLQVAGLGSEDILAAVDRNPSKHGRTLPGSGIAINREGFEWNADAYLVLPYHFRRSILKRSGPGTYIFPLPRVEVLQCA